MVDKLDFVAPAPAAPPQSWLSYATFEIARIELALEDVIARYPEALGNDMLTAVEDFLFDPFVKLMKSSAQMPVLDQQTGVVREHCLILGDLSESGRAMRDNTAEKLLNLFGLGPVLPPHE